MWKIIVAFVVFAAVSLFVLKKYGGDIDMGGEKHGADAVHAPDATASVPAGMASAASAAR